MTAQPSWDRAAVAYDLQLALQRRALDVAVALADPGLDDRVADIATGTGALLRRLAARPVPPRTVIGVDTSPAMLARAGRAALGWRLCRADARALPLTDGSQELVFVAYLLHLLAPGDRAAVLSEARRVLTPSGRLVVVTVARAPRSLLAPAYTALAAYARRSSGIIAGLRPFDPRPELPAAGLVVRHAHLTTRGYPSLVVLAQPERTP